MTVIELLEKLRRLGYEIAVNDGKIRCIHVGQNKLREDEILPLIDKLKSNKNEVIKYLQEVDLSWATERDYQLEKQAGMPRLNPKGFKCASCGAMGERYCLGTDNDGRWWWAWWCLKCRPYREPKRN